jgi:phosphate starvation-inducible PhoH-like protein
MDLHEKRIKLEDIDMLTILGYNDEYLQLIESKFESIITVRGNAIIIRGKPAEIKIIEAVFNELIYIIKKNGSLNIKDVNTVLELIQSSSQATQPQPSLENNIVYYGVKEPIRTRTKKQIDYCKKVLENDLVFAIGPAGTGKTYLAVAMALSSLKKNEVSKIILSRPAVEAGESLGFLPGDLKEKLDPYIKPLTDALFDMIPPDKLKSFMEKNVIEIIPLAYMRGRTLSNSFIILMSTKRNNYTDEDVFNSYGA